MATSDYFDASEGTAFQVNKVSLANWYSRPVFHGVRLLAHTTGDEHLERVSITYGTPDGTRGYIVWNEPPAPEHWLYESYGYEAVYDHPLTYAQIVGLAQAAKRAQADADRHNREQADRRGEG